MRKPMVTRTIATTKCTVICLDTEIGEAVHRDVVLPRTYKDEDTMLKEAKKQIDSETVKAVKVVYSTIEEALYGMDEADFIANAVILPARKNTNENTF